MTQRTAAAHRGDPRARARAGLHDPALAEPLAEGGAPAPRAAAHARALGAARRRPRHRAGRGVRDRRPERLGQVDAAEAARRDLRARRRGTLAVGGRVGSLIEIGAGFHPEFTGVENVYLNAAIYGLKRELRRPSTSRRSSPSPSSSRSPTCPVRTYSSGMYMRLGFSVAMHIQPDVLLLDEVLAVGDEAFQQKCYGKIGDFKRGGGTIVFVSHDPARSSGSATRRCCSTHGRSVERGPAGDVVRAYHRRLVSASQRERRRPRGPTRRAGPRARGARGGRRRERARPLHRGRADGARGLALRRGGARRRAA